jgi:hypothetical protein
MFTRLFMFFILLAPFVQSSSTKAYQFDPDEIAAQAKAPKPIPQMEAIKDGFRTPAKLLGSAFTVKLTINRDGTEYVVPVWVKPDQATSSLDRELLKDMGWTYADTRADDVNLSGHEIDHVNFKNVKSDWAYYPTFARICCYGVIGQDILKDFDLRFDPQAPAHIEWRKQPDPQNSSPGKPQKDFKAALASLFNLKTEKVKVRGKEVDLSETPYDVDLLHKNLKIDEHRKILGEDKLKIRDKPIFAFSFIPSSRDVRIEKVAADVAESAKSVGIKNGYLVKDINFVPTSQYDQFEITALLRGKVKTSLPITIEFRAKTMKVDDVRRTFNFDFVKNEFTEAL